MRTTACVLLGGLFIALEALRVLTLTPIPDGDTLCFYPVYVSVAHGEGLSNQLLSPIGPAGPYTWHGWLQPLLLGYATFLFGGELAGALASESLLKGVGLSIYAISLRRFDAVAILGAVVVYIALTAMQGRPELLAAIILLAWLPLERAWKPSRRASYAFASCGLGLLGISQPTVATLASLFLLTYYLVEHDLRTAALGWIGVNAAAIVGVVALTMTFYEHGLSQWVMGLLHQARNVTQRNDSFGLLRYWMLDVNKPLHGAVIVGALAMGCVSVVKRGTLPFAFVSFCISAFVLLYMSARIPALQYNAHVFVPLLIAAGVTPIPPAGQMRKYAAGAIAVLASLSIFPIAVSLNALRATAAPIALADLETLVPNETRVPLPIVVALVPFSRWQYYDPILTQPDCSSSTFAIVKQANSGRFTPPMIENCSLVADKFARPLVIGGFSLPLVPRGYGYALYRAVDRE